MELLVFNWFAKDISPPTPCNELGWGVWSTIPVVQLVSYKVLDTNDFYLSLPVMGML